MVFRDVTEQKLLEDRLRELSATDGLTLLANRRSFDEALERQWHHATRHGEPVSLVMIDIDHFKAYNDLYGHGAGDRCLQQVATAIAAGVRHEGALVARYGGEEFAVILPRTESHEAAEIAEGLRRRVEALGIAHAGNPVGSRVTISVGISTRTPPQTDDFEDLMQSADQALYKAKEGGRNGVVAAG
jgi:diguanylate cyclase (GGDEF)-like protein